jgi:toxin YoeB
MMIKSWDEEAWEDYLYWQSNDSRILKKLNTLIKDIERNPSSGTGKPEPLKHKYNGYWSRRIDDRNRIVYKITDDGTLYIAQCRGHYTD